MPAAITSGYKFFGTDQHIYLICDKNKFIGFIKVGFKHLFIYDEIGIPIEINPLCVLDFYTYESCQRKGYGKIMFSEMLSKEKIEPKKMGFDRPSPKFLNFLNKYYGLNDYIPQNNNYVVFKDYFKDEPVKRDRHNIYNNYNSYNNSNNYNNSYNNSNNSYNNSNNYNSNNNISSNYNRNILSKIKNLQVEFIMNIIILMRKKKKKVMKKIIISIIKKKVLDIININQLLQNMVHSFI